MNLATFSLLLAAGVYSAAAAADEPPSAATQSRAAQAAVAQAPAAPASAPSAASAQPPSARSGVGDEKPAPSAGDLQPASGTAAAPAPPDKSEVVNLAATDAEIKQMRSRGYKPVNRNGTLVFCRDEGEIGSRFVRTRCSTLRDMKDAELSGKEFVNSIQQQGSAVQSKGP
jgi:hypothetical protein